MIGIVRNVDLLGRVTIPKEARRILNIQESDPVSMTFDKDTVYIKKYIPIEEFCIICETKENLISLNEGQICKNCAREVIDKCGL